MLRVLVRMACSYWYLNCVCKCLLPLHIKEVYVLWVSLILLLILLFVLYLLTAFCDR